MRVLFVSSEFYPLAKTGGLADVSAALPAALRDLGIDVRVLLPGYPEALERALSPRVVLRLGDPLGCGETRLLESFLPNSDAPIWLVDCLNLYDRAGGLYQDAAGADWPDNHLRFALLDHVAAGIAGKSGRWRPDVIHANDWHAGLVPLLVSAQEGHRAATVLTIHNLAYQGIFETGAFAQLDLPAETFPEMEFYGRISFLKAGIRSADAITTVSPTYAKEILRSDHGCGLEGVLREKASCLTGILNGVDYGIWDPSIDPYLACNYTTRSPAPKSLNKRAIQTELGLQVAEDKPLLAFMGRLVDQKAPDVVLEALPALLEDGMQFALVADGERGYEERFRQLAADYPARVAIQIGYEERLAHRLLGGADMLLHPSRFEPCGLVPIYAMRYGTMPLVHKTGGMADSVRDATAETIQQGTATGFSVQEASAAVVIESTRRAHSLYRQPLAWRKLQSSAMRQDFSWRRSAEIYAGIYRSLVRQPLETGEVVPDETRARVIA